MPSAPEKLPLRNLPVCVVAGGSNHTCGMQQTREWPPAAPTGSGHTRNSGFVSLERMAPGVKAFT